MADLIYLVAGAAQILMGLGGFLIAAIMQIEQNHSGHAIQDELVLSPRGEFVVTSD